VGAAAPIVDPLTGATSVASGAGPGAVAGSQSNPVTTVPTELSANQRTSLSGVLGPLAAIELVAAILVPPLVVARLRRRRTGGT
jgi:hypothetical protein